MYSSLAPAIVDDRTTLCGGSVFGGNQPDDFAIAALLRPRGRVLLLGLGGGGCARSILAMSHSVRVDAVDADTLGVARCSAYFERYFPDLSDRLSVHACDASTFLDRTARSQAYDVICVDLYDTNGYPSSLLEDEFWVRLGRTLAGDGIVIVNAWGLPRFLGPWTFPCPQGAVLGYMARYWPNVKVMWNRRNASIVASECSLDIRAEPLAPGVNARLTPWDRTVANALGARWDVAFDVCATRVPPPVAGYETSKEVINELLAARWGSDLGPEAEQLSPISFLRSPEDVTTMIVDQLRRRSSMADILPTAVASGFIEGRTEAAEVFGPWMLRHSAVLEGCDRQWFRHIAMWQMCSIGSYPASGEPSWRPRLQAQAAELLGSGR